MIAVAALAVLLCIYAAGELIAQKTKAIFSSVLSMAILLLAGFWSGLLPDTIIGDAQITGFGNVIAGLLIVSLGTTIDFQELKQQWRVVVTAFLCVCGAVLVIILVGIPTMGPQMALSSAPIFAGGSARQFIQRPKLVAQYGSQTETQTSSSDVHRRPLQLPPLFARPSVYLAKLGLVAVVAHYASVLTGGVIHYFAMCLVMGALFFALGFLDKNILNKTQSSGLITFFVTILIFSSLATTTPAQVVSVIGPLLIAAVGGVAGTVVVGFVCGKLLRLPFGLAVSLGISCTFGFPTTMLIPQEVAEAVGTTQEEKNAILNYLLPKMLTAGFVTVTIASVILAGVAVRLL